ncbi:transcriptional regulator, TetR family [Sphingomonas laterariae]|uniref:Transcriptional regulator, TetR family n=1 Tax=Edaphosphingomonas laterariae TaxID=861865 RepID=A0A239EMG6_9SPHN|nr:TetR family transcriptional regulator [Sphingomonas laterariae]SNS45827.1 transcriptional regulator, TetR family [Sphingomonas laterariae]
MSISRTRLSAEDSRIAALEAARALLIEEGPQAVTLKAVASRIGRTHANLLHHFGSAAGLQQALAARMAERITAQIGAVVLRARAGEADQREIVDLTFDAFGKEGAGALATWALLSGERSALDTIVEAIHRLIDELGPFQGRPLRPITLTLVLAALGDALMGDAMAKALDLPRGTAREMMLAQIHALHESNQAG